MALTLTSGAEPVAGYSLVCLRGRGGFGEVWEALAPGGVRVALKFIRLDAAEAGRERRALAVIRNIRHPHLLDVQFSAHVDDCLVLATPLCDRTLLDRLHECRERGLPGIPRDELLGYMDDLARAIDFLNEPRHDPGDGALVGVQHRDIKPPNIFLVGDSVRLADFGLAKVLAASRASHTGAMSPNYVAPEVIEGHVSRHSDQYSLAITYAQLRTGRLPFPGKAIPRVLYGHLQEPPDLAGLPEGERAVVARALAKRPPERWPTCRAFAQALREAAPADEARPAPASVPDDIASASRAPRTGSPTGRAARVAETEVPRRLRPEEARDGGPPAKAVDRPASVRRLRLVALAGLLVVTAALPALGLLPHPSRPESALRAPEPSRREAGAPCESPPATADRAIVPAPEPVETPVADEERPPQPAEAAAVATPTAPAWPGPLPPADDEPGPAGNSEDPVQPAPEPVAAEMAGEAGRPAPDASKEGLVPAAKAKVSLEELRDTPETYAGQAVALTNLYSLGDVAEDRPDGSIAVPVVASDLHLEPDRDLVVRREVPTRLDLDPRLAERLVRMGRLRRAAGPSDAPPGWGKEVAIVTVEVRRREGQGADPWAFTIVKLEALSRLAPQAVRTGYKRKLKFTYQTLTISRDGEVPGEGDPREWSEPARLWHVTNQLQQLFARQSYQQSQAQWNRVNVELNALILRGTEEHLRRQAAIQAVGRPGGPPPPPARPPF